MGTTKKKAKKKTTKEMVADATREAMKDLEKERASLKNELSTMATLITQKDRQLLEAGYDLGELRRLLDQAARRESVLAHKLRVSRAAVDHAAEDYGKLVATVANRNEIRAGKDEVFRKFIDRYRGTRKPEASWMDEEEEERSKAIATEFGWVDRSMGLAS